MNILNININKFIIINILILLSFFMITENFAVDNIVVKLTPEYIESNGNLINFNITIENIPPKESLGTPKAYSDSNINDGGCQGVDIYINYSEDYLSPVGFNWSEICQESKIKEYKFENGVFYLSIMFNNIYDDNILNIGTITFNPIKSGETNLNLTGKVSSEWGIKYFNSNKYYINYGLPSQYSEPYPNTLFYGATVNIKEVGNYSGNVSLNDELKEDDNLLTNSPQTQLTTIINKVNVTVSQKTPEVIVKEINISENEPNITVIVNTENKTNIDYSLLLSVFISSIICGSLFGLIYRRKIL